MMSRYFSILLLCGIVFACKENTDKKLTVSEPVFKKEAEAFLVKNAGDTLTKLDLEIADDDYERQTGLMYRTEMEKNQGMLFVFPDEQMRSFFMKNTRIPLDIVYLDEDYSIVDLKLNVSPMDETSLRSSEPAKYVLELNGNESRNLNLEKGDRLQMVKEL